MKTKIILALFATTLFVGYLFYFQFAKQESARKTTQNVPQSFQEENKEKITCDEDIIVCSNGSVLKRGGSNCEFTSCPARTSSATYQNKEIGIEFTFPSTSGEIYVTEYKGDGGKMVYVEPKVILEETEDEITILPLGFSAQTADYYDRKIPELSQPQEAWSPCISAFKYDSQGNACKNIMIDNTEAVWTNDFSVFLEGVPSYSSTISFSNKSSSQYKDLAFVVGYPMIEDKIRSVWDGDPRNEKEMKQAESESLKYSREIMEGKSSDPKLMKELQLIHEILSSFKFIQ